jgi:hypothetical protein
MHNTHTHIPLWFLPGKLICGAAFLGVRHPAKVRTLRVRSYNVEVRSGCRAQEHLFNCSLWACGALALLCFHRIAK